MTNYGDLLPVAMQAVDQAADLIRTSAPGILTPKGDRDYASEVDYTVERTIRAFLAEATPHVRFVGEEDGGADEGTGPWWTLDPIDGTVNYAHGLPLCAVSIALIDGDHPVLGVIDLPLLGGRYHAVEGEGAHRDGQPIHVSNVTTLSDAVVTIGDYAVGANAEKKNRARLALTEQLAAQVLRVRMLGSAAIDLAWLAEGRTNASITLSNLSWDVAAGVIIAREAGATVTDHNGKPHTVHSETTVACAPPVATALRAAVQGAGVAGHS